MQHSPARRRFTTSSASTSLPGLSGTRAITLVLRLEGLAAAIVAAVLYRPGGGGWARFGLLFLLPDLSMVGYVAGPRWGAIIYNIVHTYLSPAVLGLTGIATADASLTSVALIWGAHIGLDRALGYGLKREDGFRYTHLNP